MKQNILLINPKIKDTSQNKKVKAIINITFPTSLGVIAGYILNSSMSFVNIIDEQIYPLDKKRLLSLLNSLEKPKIVGISVLTINCGRAYELAEEIKRIDRDATVILGGIHPTVLPEEALSKPGVDIVVRGEGEKIFKELVELILKKEDYHNIDGISFKKSDSFIHNKPALCIKDLDEIPPFPYHLFEKDLHKYPSFSGIFSSRGCPHKCIFCSSRSISGTVYRYHSVERIISEIKILIRKYKQQSIFFMDDNIVVNRNHFKMLCKGIIEENLHKEAFFHGSLRGDSATDEILDMAYRANFRILYYGLETGSERLMKTIDKGETVALVEDAIRRSARKGFSTGATIIFGLPSETRKERYETIKFARNLPLSTLRFNTLVPYPGTPVYEKEYPAGKIFIKENWENFGVQYMWESDDIPYVPDGCDRIELIFDTMWANYSYYLSIKGIKKLFMEKYAGGNVIKLKEKWYLSYRELKKMFDLFSYLSLRFIDITARMLWKRLAGMIF